MLLVIIENVLGFIIESVIFSLVCFILSPVVWLLFLPFILIIALFRRGQYVILVIEMLGSVNFYWRNWWRMS
jgi:hypothetical protein